MEDFSSLIFVLGSLIFVGSFYAIGVWCEKRTQQSLDKGVNQ